MRIRWHTTVDSVLLSWDCVSHQATAWMAHESHPQHPIYHLNYFRFHISMYFLMPQINLHLRQIACPWLPDPLRDEPGSHEGLRQPTVGLELISIHHVPYLADWFTSGDEAPRMHDWERPIIKMQARRGQLNWRTSVSGGCWCSPLTPWLCDVKQWFNWWNLKGCPCAGQKQSECVCVCFCGAVRLALTPPIARTASGPEAKGLSPDPPGLGGCLRSACGNRDRPRGNVCYCKSHRSRLRWTKLSTVRKAASETHRTLSGEPTRAPRRPLWWLQAVVMTARVYFLCLKAFQPCSC